MLKNMNQLVALIGVDSKNTRVVELDNDYTVEKLGYEMVDSYCRKNISSLKGRIEGSKELISSPYKLPVVINEEQEIIMFYTRSIKDKTTCWFVLDKIYEYKKVYDGVEITLINNKVIKINESFRVFDDQYSKALKLKLALERRKRPIFI